MIHKQVSNVARRFKQIFSEQIVNALGKSTRFCQRVREITPYRLALGLIEVFSTMRVETIADAPRGFNALCERKVQYKPFHHQLVKDRFPVFTRTLCEQLMGRLTVEVLRFTPKTPFAKFSPILVHDGTSFGIKSTLKKVYPGRFTKTSPAAVELHVSMDLLSEGLDVVTLAPDSESEVHHAPAPHTIAGGLFLGDRMFFNKSYLASIEAEGGFFLIKAKGNLNPTIRHAYTSEGREIKPYRNPPLATLKPKMARYKALDLDVEWEDELKARLVVTWNAKENKPRYLVTNLSRTEFTLEEVCTAYRLRWQIELMFKEWKSYTNLHAFNTSKENIAEGFIWAALCASLFKRYCAHLTQRLCGVPISTRKVAMCLHHVLADIFSAILHCPRQLNRAIKRALHFLSHNAQRAHPKRDQRTGRLQLGLEHVYDALKN